MTVEQGDLRIAKSHMNRPCGRARDRPQLRNDRGADLPSETGFMQMRHKEPPYVVGRDLTVKIGFVHLSANAIAPLLSRGLELASTCLRSNLRSFFASRS